MKTIKKQTELRLIDVLDEIKATAPQWQAQLYRLSALRDFTKTHQLDTELTTVIDRLSLGQEVFVFMFSDSDILLLGKNISKSLLQDMTSYIMRRLPADMMHMQTRPLSPIFHLESDWGALHELCVEKEKARLAQREIEDRRANAAQPSTLQSEARRKLFAHSAEEREKRLKPAVLMVEDDLLSQKLVRSALEGISTIETAATAAAARAAYMAMAPNIVFMDIGLPDGSGQDLLDEILTLDPQAYVVMLSGNCYPETIQNAIRHGAKGFVGKPFSRTKLLEYISHAPQAMKQQRANTIL